MSYTMMFFSHSHSRECEARSAAAGLASLASGGAQYEVRVASRVMYTMSWYTHDIACQFAMLWAGSGCSGGARVVSVGGGAACEA